MTEPAPDRGPDRGPERGPERGPDLAAAQPAPVDTHLRLPALDGLRGVAVILVLLVHFSAGGHHNPLLALYFRLVGAGWTGVDLFFVLSGFLITRILLAARESPRYFQNFYARRVLRIFPLYYGVLFVALVLGPLLTGRWPQGPSQLWLWLYGSSVYPAWTNQWNEFPNALGLRLRHFWSLSIEEHFYLVWPFLVWWLSRRTLRRVCVFLFMASLALRIAMRAAGFDYGPIYSFTPARLDGLSVGAFLAILTMEGSVSAARLAGIARVVLVVLVVCGSGAAVCSAVGGTSNFTNWPMLTLGISFFALFYGALLVLVLQAPASSRLGRVFGGRVLGFFGAYSYGIYVFSGLLIDKFDSGPLSMDGMTFGPSAYLPRLFLHTILCSAISVAIAFVSYNLFEKPFLKLKRFFA